MLQSLGDMKDSEIDKLIAKSVDEIESIGKDYQTTMRLLGATEYNKNKSAMQEALIIYPELFRDVYNREILKQTKKSLVKQAKGGRLRINGKYLFISPDPFAFCEWLFKGEQRPKGLLANGEVYTNQFKDGDELDCLRSPHLYQEHAVRINKRNELTDKWLGGTKCVYFSAHDMISRILQQDFDGDISLVVKDRTLTTVAKRNMQGIVPLSYDLKKARGGIIDANRLYEGVSTAYTGGSIGPISNAISKVKNANGGKLSEEQIKVIAWLTMKNNQVIDFAKTLWKSEPPKEVADIIKKYTQSKLPNFFQYAKDKDPVTQVEPPNESTMNRISAKIPDARIRYNNKINKFDWTMLTNKAVDYTIRENSLIIERYNYWVKNQRRFDYGDNEHINENDLYKYRTIAQDIIEFSNESIDFIVNSLVAYLYTVKKSSNKKMLWACFGDVIVANLKANVSGKVCPICGKRFEPNVHNQVCCSVDCAHTMDIQKKRENRQQVKPKTPGTLDI